MAEIVAFPNRAARKKQALEVLAGRISAHMAQVFYHRDILDVPVQRYASAMVQIMMHDGTDYSIEVLDHMGTNPAALARIEAVFIQNLKDNGII